MLEVSFLLSHLILLLRFLRNLLAHRQSFGNKVNALFEVLGEHIDRDRLLDLQLIPPDLWDWPPCDSSPPLSPLSDTSFPGLTTQIPTRPRSEPDFSRFLKRTTYFLKIK